MRNINKTQSPINEKTKIESFEVDLDNRMFVINKGIRLIFNYDYHFRLVMKAYEKTLNTPNNRVTGLEMLLTAESEKKDDTPKVKRIKEWGSLRNLWFDFFSSRHKNGSYFRVERIDHVPVGDISDITQEGIEGDNRRAFLKNVFLHNKKRQCKTSEFWLPILDIYAKNPPLVNKLPETVQTNESFLKIGKIAICGSTRSPYCNKKLINEMIKEIAGMLAERPIDLCCGLSGVGSRIYDRLVHTYNMHTFKCDPWCGHRRNIIEPADIVIFIGGYHNTEQEADIAMSLNKLIIPLRATGGAAQYCYDEMKRKNYRVTIDKLSGSIFTKLGRSKNSKELLRIIKDVLYSKK